MKKLTINRLALGNLKHRRKQYSIMLIGILLAMIFSSATLFFIFSLTKTNKEAIRSIYGKQNISLIDIDENAFESAYEKGLLTDCGVAHYLGFAFTDDESFGATVASADEGFRDIYYQSLLDGRYPENEGEVAVEKNALLQLGFEPKVGQTVKLNFKIQNGKDYLEKVTEKEYTVVGILKDKRSNHLRDRPDDFYKKLPAIFVKEGTPVDLGGKERTLCLGCLSNFYDIFDRNSEFCLYMKSQGVDIAAQYNEIVQTFDLYYMDKLGVSARNSAALSIVLSVVLFFASGLIIINSFNANLKERKKQIGMLRAVGATKRQIRHIFSREALIITLICLPLSLLISTLGVILLANLILDESTAFYPEWSVLALCAVVSVIMVMLATFIPLRSASRITPMQAIRDIESVRKLKNKKVRTQKQFKTENLLAKRYRMLHKGSTVAVVFILIITIVLSCYGVSLVKAEYDDFYDYGYDYSFLGAGSGRFMDNIFNFADTGLNENDRQEILSLPYIKSANGIKYGCANLIVDNFDDYFKIFNNDHGSSVFNYSSNNGTVYDENDPEKKTVLTKENWDLLMSNPQYTKEYQQIKNAYNFSGDYYPVSVTAGNLEDVKKLGSCVVDGKIDIDKLNSGEEIIIVAPRKIGLVVEQQKHGSFTNIEADENMRSFDKYVAEGTLPYKAGDKITIDILSVNDTGNNFYSDEGPGSGDIDFSKIKRTTREFTIGAIVSPNKSGEMRSRFLWTYNDIGIATSVQGMEQFMPGKKYSNMYVKSSVEIDDEIDKEIMDMLTPIAQMYSGEVWSVYNSNKETRAALRTGLMSLAAIIILFTVIAASIVNNSIAASIREDKRKIGTLRAVGADAKVLASSYIKQLFYMFGWGIGLGFISIALIYLGAFLYHRLMPLWVNVVGELEDFHLKLYFLPTIIVCVVLFLICSVNLWLKVKKEMKNSIVENIREL